MIVIRIPIMLGFPSNVLFRSTTGGTDPLEAVVYRGGRH